MSETALTDAGYSPINLVTVERATLLHGRNVSEGYQRGWGLEFGDLNQQIEAHPLYQEAIAAASGRTVLAIPRIRNLFLLLACYLGKLKSQDCIEFGAYRGGSTLFMACILRALYPTAKIYSLDTFAGMPDTDKQVDLHSKGDFRDVSIDDVRGAAEKLKLENIVFVQGLVERTFPAKIPRATKFGLAHIDLDIYPAIRHSQKEVWPFMTPGGYIVYDDATVSSCIGATQAVEEFIVERNARSEQIFPHFVFRVGLVE